MSRIAALKSVLRNVVQCLSVKRALRVVHVVHAIFSFSGILRSILGGRGLLITMVS